MTATATPTKQTHTAGPWTVEREYNEAGTAAEAAGRSSTQIMNAAGYHVGTWIDGQWDGHCPNARLVAASPDLRDALIALLDAVEGHERRTGHMQMHPAIEQARAALALLA